MYQMSENGTCEHEILQAIDALQASLHARAAMLAKNGQYPTDAERNAAVFGCREAVIALDGARISLFKASGLAAVWAHERARVAPNATRCPVRKYDIEKWTGSAELRAARRLGEEACRRVWQAAHKPGDGFEKAHAEYMNAQRAERVVIIGLTPPHSEDA